MEHFHITPVIAITSDVLRSWLDVNSVTAVICVFPVILHMPKLRLDAFRRMIYSDAPYNEVQSDQSVTSLFRSLVNWSIWYGIQRKPVSEMKLPRSLKPLIANTSLSEAGCLGGDAEEAKKKWTTVLLHHVYFKVWVSLKLADFFPSFFLSNSARNYAIIMNNS